MHKKTLFVTFALSLGLALLWMWGAGIPTRAAPVHAGALHVCASGCAYTSIQAAVDAANPGDVIKVAAGTYTDLHVRDGITQVVYIDKTVTVQGGYTPSNWDTPDPAANPTTLDAQDQGRVMAIVGNGISPTIAGLRLTGGITPGSLIRGGGLYIEDAGGIIRDNVIYSNTAAYYGGGVYLSWSAVQLVKNTITYNTAAPGLGSGGGIYVNGGPAEIVDNTITYNEARSGGGVHIFNGRGTALDNNRIAHNIAGQGGGVELVRSEGDTLTGNVIKENMASHGGGIYIYDSQPTFVNNAVVNNEGSYRGMGIYVTTANASEKSHVRMVHTTIAGNQSGQYGDGSGVCVTDEDYGAHSTVVMTNTILADHTFGITVTQGSVATLNTTLWHGNGADRAGGGVINHAGDHTGDPDFKPDGYHIKPSSAAIDQGVNAGVTTDVDGQARPMDAGYEIGADETPNRFFVFLPLVVKN